MLPQGSHVSFRVVRESTGLLSSHCREWGLISQGGWKLVVFLQLGREALGSSRVPMRTSGNRSCSLRDIRPPFKLRGPPGIPLESQQGNKASSQVEAGNSGLLSSCDKDHGFLSSFKRGVRPRLVLRHRTRLSSRVVKGVSDTCRVELGILGFFYRCNKESDLALYCKGIFRVPFKLLQGYQALSRVEGDLGVLYTSSRKRGVPVKFQ